MKYATWEKTGDFYAPSKVTAGGYSAYVWTQRNWDSGEYREYINKNGCGHCCTATALGLHGIDINPHQEYEKCRELWGAPNETGDNPQGHFISESGIIKVLKTFGVGAEYCVMDFGEEDKVKNHISSALSCGKQVIIDSYPSDRLPVNPFSDGSHYVLAVGYANEKKEILVANSNGVKAPLGVQLTDIDTIIKALYIGGKIKDETWGTYEPFDASGYIIVG